MLKPGVYPASVTPMTPDGKIDLPAIVSLLAHFRSAGCKGIVLAGTNGEGPSLSAVEKRDLIRAAVPIFPDFAVISGIATPSLEEAIWLSQQSQKAGAVAGLVMPPGYFREASCNGIVQWFEKLMDASDLPILVYNFPQRTGITLTPEMVSSLAQHPRMLGLKDSSGEESNLTGYAKALEGHDKCLFVGNETLLWKALEAGWSGTISGAANVLATWLAKVVEEYFAGERESASVKFQLALKGIEALRGVPQPGLNKAILHRRGVLPHPSLRLPLEEPDAKQADEVLEKLAGLLV